MHDGKGAFIPGNYKITKLNMDNLCLAGTELVAYSMHYILCIVLYVINSNAMYSVNLAEKSL